MKQIRSQNLQNRVWICIAGSETERFLNIASFHQLVLYQVKRTPDGICAMVSARDVLKLWNLRKKATVSIHIVEKKGLYFWWKKTRHRRLGLVCGILSFASLYVLSLFVWDIEFAGNVRYTDSFLLSFVKGQGYEPGMKRSDVVCDLLEKKLRNEFNDITWVSARLEGTRLVVEIEENNTASMNTKTQNGTPCSIRSDKSGVIVRMVTRNGTPYVKNGDEVAEGELLVSGLMPIYDDSQEVIAYEKTAASADVWVEYEENFEVKIPRNQTIRHYTSEEALPGLILFGYRFCLPGSIPTPKETSEENSTKQDSPEQNEEVYIEQRQWHLFEHFYLPIYSETYRSFQYENTQISYDDPSLKRQADQKYREFIVQLEKLGVEIIENNVTIESDPECLHMKARLLLEKNAAVIADLETNDEYPSKDASNE